MNEDNVSGKFDEVTGKIKQSVGEAVGNERLANSGAADQVKGNAKETWGNVKDAASTTGDSARQNADARTAEAHDHAAETGHTLRDKVTSAAESIKNTITGKSEEFKDRHS